MNLGWNAKNEDSKISLKQEPCIIQVKEDAYLKIFI